MYFFFTNKATRVGTKTHSLTMNRKADVRPKCKKTKFIKTVVRDVVAHLKPQKFAVSSYL